MSFICLCLGCTSFSAIAVTSLWHSCSSCLLSRLFSSSPMGSDKPMWSPNGLLLFFLCFVRCAGLGGCQPRVPFFEDQFGRKLFAQVVLLFPFATVPTTCFSTCSFPRPSGQKQCWGKKNAELRHGHWKTTMHPAGI